MVHASDLGKDPVRKEDLELEFDEKTLGDPAKLNNQLYAVLCGITDGEVFDIVNASPAGQGLESYRRLCHRFDPMTEGRRANILQSINEALRGEERSGRNQEEDRRRPQGSKLDINVSQ